MIKNVGVVFNPDHFYAALGKITVISANFLLAAGSIRTRRGFYHAMMQG